MDRSELAKRIHAVSYLTGQFKLRSGTTSTFYIDKYRFESDPSLLDAIIDELKGLLPPGFNKLAGLELGGVPLATGLSLRISKPCLYVRKEAKTYGTRNLVEGGFDVGDKVVVVEDVTTTGGQVTRSIQEMRELGLTVNDVVCVIDREEGGRRNLETIGSTLSSVFTKTELDQLV